MRPPNGQTAMKPEQKTHRRTVSARHAAVFTACLGSIVLLATAYWLSAIRLPSPATADLAGLIRWMVLRDLQSEPPEIRTTLLSRLQEETRLDLDPAALAQQLDARNRDRLWANVLVLMETWYSNKIDAYLATPTSERPAYLDDTIAEVEEWKDLAALRPQQSTNARSAETAMLELFTQQVELWKDRASPSRLQEIREFDTALRGRWLLHALGLAPRTAH